MLKRILLSVFCLFLACLCACTQNSGLRDSAATAGELIDKATENLLWENEIHKLSENPFDELYYSYYYGAADQDDFFSVVSDYAVAVQVSATADEIGIFKINTVFDEAAFRASSTLTGDALDRAVETAAASFVESNLARAEKFCQNRVSIFLNQTENYDAAEYAKAQNALIARHGYYVYYIISGDNASIEKIITAQIDAKAL
ncbi:MAG: DUF4358 domain-containing protein [Clostridia bacterium]|nr:DUF4358 domain-containing protein [Clostridia bacterium]